MVNCKSTKNVSNFHSVSFDTTGMRIRRYFANKELCKSIVIVTFNPDC